jgi:hypothetical protein
VVERWLTGSLTTTSSNTRSSDQSAKYDVRVRAEQAQPTEGMNRLAQVFASVIDPIKPARRSKSGSGLMPPPRPQPRCRARRLFILCKRRRHEPVRFSSARGGLGLWPGQPACSPAGWALPCMP